MLLIRNCAKGDEYMEFWNGRTHGIVYTNDEGAGRRKLLEVEKENNYKGIKTKSKRFSRAENVIGFDNGDIWRVARLHNSSRGYKWNKAYVDAHNTTISMLYNFILPSELDMGSDNITYFNWVGDKETKTIKSDVCINYEAYYDEYLKLKAENEVLRDIIVKLVTEKYREK